jgi:hypothetical protein
VTRLSERASWVEKQAWPAPPGRILFSAGLKPVGAALVHPTGSDRPDRVACEYTAGPQASPGDALRRLIRLDNAPATSIGAFVKRYGLLGVSDLGVPGLIDEVRGASGFPAPGERAELLRWYHHYAALTGSAIRVAAYTRRGIAPLGADLLVLLLHGEVLRDQLFSEPEDTEIVLPAQTYCIWAMRLTEQLSSGAFA